MSPTPGTGVPHVSAERDRTRDAERPLNEPRLARHSVPAAPPAPPVQGGVAVVGLLVALALVGAAWSTQGLAEAGLVLLGIGLGVGLFHGGRTEPEFTATGYTTPDQVLLARTLEECRAAGARAGHRSLVDRARTGPRGGHAFRRGAVHEPHARPP